MTTDQEQGQEALLVQEENRSSFRLRSTTATRSILLPNDDDSISKESFQKAMLARQTLEGSTMSEELKLILDDAVQKGLAAIENRELDRAKQLLEFIFVPSSQQHEHDDCTTSLIPQVDTVSSLGFDRSFDVRHHADVLSMSSLNEILDAPLTPEQKQARFRVFWFGKHKKAIQTNMEEQQEDDESTTSPERFVTTVVCDDGTMIAEEDEQQEESSLQRIEEKIRVALDDVSTKRAVTSANGVPLHTLTQEKTIDTSFKEAEEVLDASQIMDHLNDTSQNEVSFISVETAAADEVEQGVPAGPRPKSPLRRLLKRRSSKKKTTEEKKVPIANTESAEELVPIDPIEPAVAVSPSTAVGNALNDEDRYMIDLVAGDNEGPNDNLESDAFLNDDDRYAVPADPCSFCDSLWRHQQSLQQEPCDHLAIKDQPEEPTLVVDKYTEMSTTQNVENANRDNIAKNPEVTRKKKKRFALFRRRINKTKELPSRISSEQASPKKPLQGILKVPSKSFPVDETSSVEHSVPLDGGSASTVTSHDDDIEPDPLLDRLKQQQRGLDPGPPQHQRLDP